MKMKVGIIILISLILVIVSSCADDSSISSGGEEISMPSLGEALLRYPDNETINNDKRIFHPYGYLSNNFSVISEGDWSSNNGGNIWHVEGLLLQHKIFKGYFLYKFDVRYDGKNYYMENGWLENASSLKWLESKDPSKWGEADLSNLDFYSCFVVSPGLLE